MSEPQPKLPKGYCPLETQVAGHSFELQNSASVGMIKDKTGSILKPLGKTDCAERELSFYESIQNNGVSNKDQLLMQLRPFVPVYHQKLRLCVNGTEHAFIKLENLTKNMSKPCVLDVKIGRRTWDPLATPEKRYLEDGKYVNCKQKLGLCLPGFQVYTLTTNKLLRFGKDYGKQLDASDFASTLALFFNINATSDSTCTIIAAMLQEVLKQLYPIRDWFKQQTLLHFYASSILIIYDCAELEKGIKYQSSLSSRTSIETNDFISESESTKLSNWIKVRMIDFAHVFPAEHGTLDQNYLFGIENLIAIIENLLK